MAGLDTNVLVRWLLADDAKQLARAQTLLESLVAQGRRAFVPRSVALELEWVLRSRYAMDKAALLVAFVALLEMNDIEFEDEGVLEQALRLYQGGAADFADCLHIAACLAAGRGPMWTFERRAARLPGASAL